MLLNKAIQRFRKVIKYAVAVDYLNKDPFMLYRPKTVKKPVVFLKPEELKRLEETNFENRWFFLFIKVKHRSINCIFLINLIQ